MNRPDNDPAAEPFGRRRKAAARRASFIGIVASTVVHSGLILVYSLNTDGWAALSGRVSMEAPSASTLDGTQLLNIIEIETPDPTAEAPIEVEDEEEDEEEDLPLIIVPVVVAGGNPIGSRSAAFDPIPAAAVFRIRISDPSLWMVARPDLILLTPAQRMRLELAGRLEAWNDSLNAMIAAETALMDWTKTDGKGGRWGVSPGKLHLGGITIPLPFGFGPNPWQAEQIAARRAREDDILGHVQSQVVRASWKERAEAIRRRKDRDRSRAEERRRGADTTSSRRGGR